MGQKLIDEKGNKYGVLTVLELTKDKNGRTAWLCQCDCGNTKIVRGSDLRTGKITSCGCRLNSRNKKIIDYSGQIIGNFKILERADAFYDNKNKKNVWKCECLLCNSICYKKIQPIKNGDITSCGCITRKLLSESHCIDETGNIYGDLTVLEYVEINNKMKWKCKCSCGNITYVKGSDLRTGNTKSCGCKKGYKSYEAEKIEKFLQDNSINY